MKMWPADGDFDSGGDFFRGRISLCFEAYIFW